MNKCGEIMIKIGQTLKEIRLTKGLSGKDLENLSGVGQSTISRIELDQHSPSLDTLSRICAALEIRITDLINEKFDPIPYHLQQLIETAKQLTPEEQSLVTDFLKIRLK
jgi:transcriptional regulator with XRE-family HTH domain